MGVPRERAITSEIGLRDFQALAELRYLIRQFLDRSETMAGERGLTPQQHQLMLAIAGRPEGVAPTIGYLAERLLIRHHSAVGLVDRLEAQGLVEREPGADDRRRVNVRLTERGATVLRDLSASHRAELRLLAPRLVGALGAVVADIDRDDEGAGGPRPPRDHRLSWGVTAPRGGRDGRAAAGARRRRRAGSSLRD
jgi:DNA-binding MarR family transcriptional regulator